MENTYTSDQRRICRAIKKATGYDVKMHKGGGSIVFYSPDGVANPMPYDIYSRSVCVYQFDHLSVGQWVDEFEELLKVKGSLL